MTETAKPQVDILREEVALLKERQLFYMAEHHNLEKQVVKMQADIEYIKKSQDNVNANLNKVLFIIGGGFIMAAVSWVIGGGLAK